MALTVSFLAGCQPDAPAGDKKPVNNSQQQDNNKKPETDKNQSDQNQNDQNNGGQNKGGQNTENDNAGNNNQGGNNDTAQDDEMQAPTDYKGEVLVDNDMFSIKVKSITLDSKYHIVFELVNKTQEELAFRLYSPVVNGYMYVNFGHTSEWHS